MTRETETTTNWRALAAGLPDTRAAMASAVSRGLQVFGFAHIEAPISLEDYEVIASNLGTIILRSDVKIDVDRDRLQQQTRTIERPSIYRASPLGFHTDPHAEVVSWYCADQDELDCAILLLDTFDIASHFGPAELAALGRVEVWSGARNSDAEHETLSLVPLLSPDNGGYRVYYAPWLLRESPDPECNAALEKFGVYLAAKQQRDAIALRVKKGDTVFIDNHRMLHGRGAIAEGSKRHLIRFYLRVAPQKSGAAR